MARFLFVVPPFAGHVNPTVAVAAELVERGHQVAWTGVPGLTETLLPDGARFLAAVEPEVAAAAAALGGDRPEVRGAAAFKFLQEEVLFPLADHMVTGVDAAVDAFRADLLVVDQQALAGAVVGRRRDLRWVTSATTSAELVDPLAGLPKVAAEMHRRRVDLQVRHGVSASVAHSGDLRRSPHLTLAYTVQELTGPVPDSAGDSGTILFVGPATSGRAEPVDTFDWQALDTGRPVVLVSLGTLNAGLGERFFRVAAEAFEGQEWTGVFVCPPALLPAAPPNVVRSERVPQLALLERASGVISHAGHNTVCESLAAGLPLVVAPIRDDQPVVADQVVRAGAAVRVRFARVRAEELRAAVTQILVEGPERQAARALATSFAAAGGAPAAADALLALR